MRISKHGVLVNTPVAYHRNKRAQRHAPFVPVAAVVGLHHAFLKLAPGSKSQRTLCIVVCSNGYRHLSSCFVSGRHSVSFYRDSIESRNAGVTYHLVPESVWTRQRSGTEYLPDAFDNDGFIHCTNGLDQLVAVGNMFYLNDRRPFLVLALDVSRLTSEVRYDDPDQLFPHIYGPLNTDAVIDQATVERSPDGAFLSIRT